VEKLQKTGTFLRSMIAFRPPISSSTYVRLDQPQHSGFGEFRDLISWFAAWIEFRIFVCRSQPATERVSEIMHSQTLEAFRRLDSLRVLVALRRAASRPHPP
jgi:hypothetical protein